MKQKLFSIFCCLLLSASMVAQAQLLDAGSDSSESKKIPQRANLLKERNNAPQTDWYTYWLYADDSKMNTNGYGYLGALGSVKVYRYQWDSDLQIYFAFTDNSATWTSPISGATCVMPARGAYTVTDNNPSDHVIGGKNTSWDGNGTRSRYVEDGTSFYFNSATWYVEEGVDGPYIYTTNLTLRYIYNSRFYDPLGYSVAFKIGEPAVYKSVTVQSESTTKGTVSKSMKSGYVYTTNFTDWKEGSTYTITATPNSGYRFVRWEKNGSQISTDATTDVVIDGDATYTAIFESNAAPQYTITVQADNDAYCTVSGGGTYYAGTNVTISSASKNEHLYIFDHWLKDGVTYAGGATITPTVTAAATYRAVYRVANNGTITATASPSGYGSATVSQPNTNGGTAVTLNATPQAGYAFTGWDDNNDGTVDNTDNPRTVYVDGDKDYVAKFVVETPLCAAVKYNTANHEILWAKHGDSDWASNYMTWNDEPDNFVRVRASDYTDNSMNHIQLCFWVDDYSVRYNGTIGPKEGTYTVAEAYIAGSGSQNNYWFLDKATYLNKAVVGGDEDKGIGNWRTDLNMIWTTSQSPYCAYIANKTCDYCSPTDFLIVPENSTAVVSKGKGGYCYVELRNALGRLLFTIGEKADAYTLNWDANGGELSGNYTAVGSVNEGAGITAPTATRTGYTFTGWSPTFTGTMPSNNVTYTAQWTPNTYTVTFAANGGSGTMANQAFTYGVAQNLTANAFTGPAATVTYDYNGATGGNSKASETVNATFSGWLDNNSNTYTDEQEVNNLTTTNGATVTMTAQWEMLAEVTLPQPTKTGYTLHAWEGEVEGMNMSIDETNDWSFVLTTIEHVTMTAQWNRIEYTITYEGLEGATNSNPTSYNVESETIVLANPGARAGYTFAGWTDESDNTITQITTGSTGNRTLTATWNAATTLDLYDNQDATYYNNIKALNGQTYDVTYHRSVAYTSDNGNARWYTLCLPFDVDQSQLTNAGLLRKVYEYRYATGSADEGDQVTFHFRVATSMVAGQGYLVKATGDMGPDFEFTGVTLDTDKDTESDVNDLKTNSANAYKESGDIAIVGVLRSGTLNNDDRKVMGLANNKIWYPHSSGNPMPAYRAYFYNPNASASVMPRVRIEVEGEGTTELEVVDGELISATEDSCAPSKYIRNGVLIIERNGVRYDAQGKRM